MITSAVCQRRCSRLDLAFSFWKAAAVRSENTASSATMVAKDYPFYLTVQKANCGLEVQTRSIFARETEESAGLQVLERFCCSFSILYYLEHRTFSEPLVYKY